DNYDRRRFKKIYGMSQGLRNLEVAEKPFPTFEPLLGDIWSSLYKMKPILKEKEQLQDVLKTNHSLLIQMFKDERFEHYRNYTKLDELASAIGTVKFGEKTKDWLEEQREENEALDRSEERRVGNECGWRWGQGSGRVREIECVGRCL